MNTVIGTKKAIDEWLLIGFHFQDFYFWDPGSKYRNDFYAFSSSICATSDAGTDHAEALEEAFNRLQDTSYQYDNKEVYLITDGRANGTNSPGGAGDIEDRAKIYASSLKNSGASVYPVFTNASPNNGDRSYMNALASSGAATYVTNIDNLAQAIASIPQPTLSSSTLQWQQGSVSGSVWLGAASSFAQTIIFEDISTTIPLIFTLTTTDSIGRTQQLPVGQFSFRP